MALFRLILHIAVLFLFYGAGSLLQQWLNLPVPGSILGMILLFMAIFQLACWIHAGFRKEPLLCSGTCR
ncbi:CidA/LrgA family protein [Sinobaca sp. H24]|uniref:CidA/LrgA family protein n=1 Tax=Sinobaca sp. H24 TaxID=2923376 RepID=UPI0035B01C85